MRLIPVTQVDGGVVPSEPLPLDAPLIVCDGEYYRVAETPEDVAELTAPANG